MNRGPVRPVSQPHGPWVEFTAGGVCYETRKQRRHAWLDRGFTHRPRKSRGPTGRGWRRLGCISLTRRPAVVAVVDHADPVGALAAWAAETLIVPAWASAKRCTDGVTRLRGGLAAGVVGRARIGAQHGAKKRKISDRGGPGARLFVRTPAASWLARGDCVHHERKGGRTTAASSRDCGSVES